MLIEFVAHNKCVKCRCRTRLHEQQFELWPTDTGIGRLEDAFVDGVLYLSAVLLNTDHHLLIYSLIFENNYPFVVSKSFDAIACV